jgi:hypothetical protein
LKVGPKAVFEVGDFKPDIPKSSDFASQLPPGKSNFFTLTARDVSKQDFDEAMTHDDWVVVAGTFWYYDFAGNLYTSDFCGTRLATGAIGNCHYKHKAKKPN